MTPASDYDDAVMVDPADMAAELKARAQRNRRQRFRTPDSTCCAACAWVTTGKWPAEGEAYLLSAAGGAL